MKDTLTSSHWVSWIFQKSKIWHQEQQFCMCVQNWLATVVAEMLSKRLTCVCKISHVHLESLLSLLQLLLHPKSYDHAKFHMLVENFLSMIFRFSLTHFQSPSFNTKLAISNQSKTWCKPICLTKNMNQIPSNFILHISTSYILRVL